MNIPRLLWGAATVVLVACNSAVFMFDVWGTPESYTTTQTALSKEDQAVTQLSMDLERQVPFSAMEADYAYYIKADDATYAAKSQAMAGCSIDGTEPDLRGGWTDPQWNSFYESYGQVQQRVATVLGNILKRPEYKGLYSKDEYGNTYTAQEEVDFLNRGITTGLCEQRRQPSASRLVMALFAMTAVLDLLAIVLLIRTLLHKTSGWRLRLRTGLFVVLMCVGASSAGAWFLARKEQLAAKDALIDYPNVPLAVLGSLVLALALTVAWIGRKNGTRTVAHRKRS